MNQMERMAKICTMYNVRIQNQFIVFFLQLRHSFSFLLGWFGFHFVLYWFGVYLFDTCIESSIIFIFSSYFCYFISHNNNKISSFHVFMVAHARTGDPFEWVFHQVIGLNERRHSLKRFTRHTEAFQSHYLHLNDYSR